MMLRHLKEEANRLISKGKFDKAIEKLNQAIRLDPSDASLRLRLAECCRRLGQNNTALQSLLAASDVLKRQGHFGRAAAALKLALELAPGNASLLQSIRQLESQKLLASVSNSGVISGVLPGAFHGYAQVTPDESQAPFARKREIALELQPSRERMELEQGGPVVMGVAEEPEVLDEDELTEIHPIPEVDPLYPQIRRLGDTALAIKASAQSRWIVIQSQTPLRVTFADPVTKVSKGPSPSLKGELLTDEVVKRIREAD